MKKLLILSLILIFIGTAFALPDEFLSDLGKDYVYWRAKILLNTRQGNVKKADKARSNFKRAEYSLSHGGYTEDEQYNTIKEAEEYYKRNPVR